MGQKDISEKLLEDYNDVFADIVNVLLFDGKNTVDPAVLEEAKLKSQYKADDEELHEIERDVAKYWKDKEVTIALYGVENQSRAEKVMPLRILGYDGAAYRSQLLEEKKEVFPVVTIILHFGMGHWNQPKNLKRIVKVPEELDGYVNDYKIHVFEIAWLTDEQVAMFKSDFRIVAEYFTQMRKNKKYEPSDIEVEHVDAVLKLLSVFGESERFEKLAKSRKKKGGKKRMTIGEMFEQMFVEGERAAQERGENIGESRGMERGEAKSLIDSVANLQVNLHLSLEAAVEAIGKTMEDYEKSLAIVKNTSN